VLALMREVARDPAVHRRAIERRRRERRHHARIAEHAEQRLRVLGAHRPQNQALGVEPHYSLCARTT